MKFPVPFGILPNDSSFCIGEAGAESTVTEKEFVRVITSPPELILKLVCNGLAGLVLFLSEQYTRR